MITALVLGIYLSLLATGPLMWASCLRLGLKLTKTPGVTWKRVWVACIATLLLNLAVALPLTQVNPSSESAILALALFQLVVAVAIPCFVFAKVFAISRSRAFVAWLPTLLSAAGCLALVHFAMRPYLLEAFSAPTNSMAPTLLGRHVIVTCPECGGEAIAAPREPRRFSDLPPPRICSAHFHITYGENTNEVVHGGDRFITAKFLAPRRWDLVAFRLPFAPGEVYLKRLVGLPGEEIVIKQGKIWADGKVLTPPQEIDEIQYLDTIEGFGPTPWGTQRRPAKLGDDEYFMLGDFSAASADSRFWTQGAPGYSPYAVPRSHFMGVVTHIYWPPARIRAFR